ncbi:MAG: hypothetical protein FWD63_02775 [Propionibacteriaceae bacterium]|nr:hypothetical protein [Propionibacteriaceae bacterium]
MDKAKPFDAYFVDESLSDHQCALMQATRRIVHELYPAVVERVSYAMPGFYPAGSTKATQQLFFVMAAKQHLGIYGTFGIDEAVIHSFESFGVQSAKGSLRVPYDIPVDAFERLLSAVITYNLGRFEQNAGH